MTVRMKAAVLYLSLIGAFCVAEATISVIEKNLAASVVLAIIGTAAYASLVACIVTSETKD